MRLNEYQIKALTLQAQGYNCAQAVACAFKDLLDLDEAIIFKLAEGFGLGMGNRLGVCGALSGAVIVLSYLKSSAKLGAEKPKSKHETYQLCAELAAEFMRLNGALYCRDIKNNKQLSCQAAIANAVEILYTKLGACGYKL